ncbi:MAG TPA: hypothetical protein GX497_01820 [Bacillus bacterium]|nr:hypothetical protein [Bacillus sp. (in: firmicutes)]
MHLFTVMYFAGLLIGIGFYALTFFFSKEIDYRKRISIVAVIGTVVLAGSLVIGGFRGMPFGVLSVGILTISILLVIFGKKSLLRKSIFTIIVLFVAGSFAFSALNKTDYWIISKKHKGAIDEISRYLNKVQSDTTISGYKIFDINEGSKAVILSLGKDKAGDNIEVLNIKEISGKTVIYIRTFYNKSEEKNPMIIIGLDRVMPEVEIRDTDGTLYDKASE